ncbi:Abnormal spindle microcephaly-associated protein, partial [Globisporangium splendens]
MTPTSSSSSSPYSSVVNPRRKNSIYGVMKRRSSSALPSLAPSKSERLCALISQVLRETRFLNALHVEVLDVSCAQLQYRLLGTKRYWHRSVTQEKQDAKRWEAKVHEIRCRKSVSDAVGECHWVTMPRLSNADVYLRHLGYFDTERGATLACVAAMKACDVTNPFTGRHVSTTPLPSELVRYFQIQVVSDAFQRKTQRERLRCVYELLLGALASSSEATAPSLPLYPGSESRLRGFTWVGEHVARLPLWRFLSLHFSITAKTPVQWMAAGSKASMDPTDTDRFGPSHLANDRTLGVNTALLPVSRGLSELVSLNQEDANAWNKSVLPRFYHGLPDELKRMIADEQVKADQVHHHSAGYRKLFKNTESSFVKKYMKRKCEYVQIALKLQRSVRVKTQRKVLREIFQRQRGALAFQRLYRGRRARKYVKAYFRVMTCAALIVQSVYRGHVSQRHTKALRKLMEASTLTIQGVYQDHLARKYVRWVHQLERSAITVERAVRGFMARQRVKRIRLARYKVKVIIPSCIQIQRVWRGHRGRLLVKAKREVREKLEVLHPAAVRIERILRGYLARRLAKRFREATKAALQIQTF